MMSLDLLSELIKCKEELTKYKRAFEILKPYVRVDKDELGNSLIFRDYLKKDIIVMYPFKTKEEYELLEELMKSE